MKKSAKLKRRTIRLIVKNLIVFAVLIAVAAAGVRSWFVQNAQADASGIYVECTVPEGMEIAIVAPGGTPDANTVWHDESFTISPDDYSFINALSFTEITGDGKAFIKPLIKQYGSVAVADTTRVNQWTTATANSEYLSFDVYIRCTSTRTIYLDKATYCGPENPAQTWGDNTNGWSPHTVIGAARVAVEELASPGNVNSALTQKLLWIPAPFLHFDPVNRKADAQLISNITNTSNTYGLAYTNDSNQLVDDQNGTYNHGYYSKTGSSTATRNKILYNSSVANAGTKVTANTSIAATDLANGTGKYVLPYDVPIVTLVDSDAVTYDSRTYYQKVERVNIWIEGEDPESRSFQVTGQFKTVLNFKLGS